MTRIRIKRIKKLVDHDITEDMSWVMTFACCLNKHANELEKHGWEEAAEYTRMKVLDVFIESPEYEKHKREENLK